MTKQVEQWREFWDKLSLSSDPIAATDRPMVDNETYRLYANEIISKLDLRPNDYLLDIGCGTGILDRILNEHVSRLYAVDFSEHMVRRAREYLTDCRAETLVTDSSAIPFVKGRITKVVIYAVAQYMNKDQLDRMFAEVNRFVVPGGLILLGEVPRKRDISLWKRIGAIWAHEGMTGVLKRTYERIIEGWLRFSGRWTGRFVRPAGPEEILHSEEELLALARSHDLRAWVLPQDQRLPWFHQTFDLLAEKR